MSRAEIIVAIIVAVVSGSGIPVWFLNRFDRRNTDQHAENQEVLTRIEAKVDAANERMSEHIDWHLGSAWDGSTERRRQG